MNKVLIITIALGKYTDFLPRFIMTAKKNLLPEMEKEFLIITDQDIEDLDVYNSVIHISKQTKLCWPLDTLMRFHYFCKEGDLISQFDYIYYFDSDMAFNNKITAEEILPSGDEKFVGVLHPGFYDNENATFDRDPMSSAYVEDNHKGPYFQGCVIGGKKLDFYSMIFYLKKQVEENFSRNKIALWHDESHLNWYYYMKIGVARKQGASPIVKILNPGFAYPEKWNLPFDKKIIHLAKDNIEIRK